MVGRWSEAATLKFVYFYKLHECLWNTKSEFYNVKDARNAAYSDLVLQMGMPDFDIRAAKVKIKNLRAHYFTELKKVRYAAAMGDRYEPTLYWYKEMDSFLKDIIGDIPSLQQPEVITADSIYDSSCIYESIGIEDEDSMGKASPIFHMGEMARGVGPSRPSRPPRQASSVVTNSRKRKRANTNEPQDEFEAFGKSVAAQLRKLSVSRALRAQTRLQSILTEERIHDLETTTPPSGPQLPAVRELPEVNGGGGSSIDSGTDSGIDASSAGGSVLGLPSPPILAGPTPMFEPVRNSFLLEAKNEFKQPEAGPSTNDVIVKAECELITLDEDDPFEGH